MAVTDGWPDPKTALPTQWKPIRKLFEALDERYAARAAAGGGTSSRVRRPEAFGPRMRPLYAALTHLRDAICTAAPSFIDMDKSGREAYGNDCWASFPVCYASTDPLKGDHSLAAMPAPWVYEHDKEQLRLYRSFLANCIWWLKKFRYVRAGGAYYAQYARASGGHYTRDIVDPFGGAGEHEESGDPIGTILANATVTRDVEIPCTRRNARTCRFTHRVSKRNDDWVVLYTDVTPEEARKMSDEELRGVVYSYRCIEDYDVSTGETIDVVQYSDMRVPNGTGIPAVLFLMPVPFDAPNRTIRREEYTAVEREESAVGSRWSTQGYFAQSIAASIISQSSSYTARSEEWIGGGFQETHREEDTHTAESADPDPVYHNTHQETITRWSVDGSEHDTETGELEENEQSNGLLSNTSNDFVRYDEDFDGFARFSVGVPMRVGIVQPRHSVRALPAVDVPWQPYVWDLTAFLPEKAIACEFDTREMTLEAQLDLIPYFDFNEGYGYKA